MEKGKTASLWVEEGYSLVTHEGLDGIQVERLARILQLNKSGFYHYFGDMEGYFAALINLHAEKVKVFLDEVRELKTLDPDYLNLLIKHASPVMFQVKLTRTPNNRIFYQASEIVDQQVNEVVYKLWCDYLDVSSNSDLTLRYYAIVRDMFYTRITFANLNYPFLHNLVNEARQVVTQLTQQSTFQPNTPTR